MAAFLARLTKRQRQLIVGGLVLAAASQLYIFQFSSCYGGLANDLTIP
jgi:hypothetical protein